MASRAGSYAVALDATSQFFVAVHAFHDAVDDAYDRVEHMVARASTLQDLPVADFAAITQQLRDATAILRRQ